VSEALDIASLNLPDLPTGWHYKAVSEIGATGEQPVLTGPFGTNLGRGDFVQSGVPLLTIGCLTQGGINLDKALFVSEEKAQELSRYRLKEGDLLFSRMASVGRAGLVPKRLEGALFNYHIMRLRLDEARIDTRLFINYVRGAKQVRDYLKAVNHGATRDGINTEQLLGLPVAVPPLAEQREIVAEIEKQFSRLDEAVANLRRVKANLKRYKAAVLKAAVEGRLVETEASLAHREGRSYETGVQLLQRIAECRRQQWVGRGKYKEAQSNWTGSRKDVPDGWCWTTVNDLAVKIVDGTHHTPTYVDEGIPFISVKDIRESRISFEATRLISAAEHDELSKRCNPEFGDVLITKSGTIGRTAIVATTTPFSLFVSVALIKPVKGIVDPKYLMLTLDAYIQSIDISQDVKGGLLKNLHLEDLRLISVQLPPAAEQVRIVAEVDRHLSVLRGVEAEVDANLLRAQVLRQSVLTSFLGGNNGQANSFLSG